MKKLLLLCDRTDLTPEENLLLSYFFTNYQNSNYTLPIQATYKLLTSYSKHETPITEEMEKIAQALKEKGLVDFEIIASSAFGAPAKCFALNTISNYLQQAKTARTFTTIEFSLLQHKNLNLAKVSALADLLRVVAVANRKKSKTCTYFFQTEQEKVLSWLEKRVFQALKESGIFTAWMFKKVEVAGVEKIRLELVLRRGGKKAIKDREEQERKLERKARKDQDQDEQEVSIEPVEESETEQEQEVEQVVGGLFKYLNEVGKTEKEKENVLS